MHTNTHNAKSYYIGFILSLITTLLAFKIVNDGILNSSQVIFAVVTLALIQLTAQLLFFLQLGKNRSSNWNILGLLFAVMVVIIVVFGSLWIMNNLNYNMMHSSPEETDQKLLDGENINR